MEKNERDKEMKKIFENEKIVVHEGYNKYAERFIEQFDKQYRFKSRFYPSTGLYKRSGVFDEDGFDTGVDSVFSSYPTLIDFGIMSKCVCANKCNVDCYQKACDRTTPNLSLEDIEMVLKQISHKVTQCALGGAGDVDTYEDLEGLFKLFKKYDIVPSFTTSGIAMTPEKARLCKKYCGAVAVSEHHADYTEKAIKMLLNEGVTTNLHYVLSNESVKLATERIKNNSWHEGLNAVIFLTYKDVGLGKREKVMTIDDPNVKEFFKTLDVALENGTLSVKPGFDSCTVPGIVNFMKNVDMCSVDACEGGRYSCYITPELELLPCSFDNQDKRWAVSLRDHTFEEAWNSDKFNHFRTSLYCSCPDCKDRENCRGGCPIINHITLCDRKERMFIQPKMQ